MKLADMNRKTIARTARCYDWLGEETRDVPRGFAHVTCPRWTNAAMAPMLALKPRLTKSDVDAVEAFWAKPRRRGPYDSKKAYLQFYGLPTMDVARIDALLRARGWEAPPVDSKNNLNLWTRPLPLAVPKVFDIVTARYFSPRVHRDFTKMMRANFGVKADFLAEFDALHRRVEPHLVTVVIRDKENQPSAAGLVFTRGRQSYLYCGSVRENARGKGLWRLLTAARQAASDSGGDHLWITTTSNPRITGKVDLGFAILTYTKPLINK